MKKIYYIIILSLVIISIAFIVFWPNKNEEKPNVINNEDSFNALSNEEIVPAFMTDAEKSDRDLSPDSKVQVLKRTDEGEVMSFKIIKSDEDIIKNRNDLRIRQ